MVLNLRIGLICVALSVGASGCTQAETPTATAEKQAAGDLPARLNALLERTRKQMVFVAGGTFEMGDFGVKYGEEKLPYSPEIDDDVLHQVTLDSYSIGAYKVTYEDYDVFSDEMHRARITMHEDEQPLRLPKSPAGLNWQEGKDYCQWLGKKLGAPMDLPTEAQWEYAARNRGGLVIFATDNGQVDDGRNVASFKQLKEYGKQYKGKRALWLGLAEVGRYPATPLGLFDMMNNGFEWVEDWYAPQYASNSQNNPSGPSSGREKVIRGHEKAGGDTLALVAMTFARHSANPAPPPAQFSDGRLTGWNQNLSSTARCVANSPKPLIQ